MKVKFVPQNVEFEIKPGQSVMHLAEDNGIYVKSVCRGVPSCAECRVRIVEGETNVFQPVAAELALIGTGHFIDRRRLACQLQCIGNITVDMSEQIAKQQGLIGGRKAKAAKAIGDRVEEETVIRSEPSGRDHSDREDRPERSERPDRGERRERGGGDRPRGPQGGASGGSPGGQQGPRQASGPQGGGLGPRPQPRGEGAAPTGEDGQGQGGQGPGQGDGQGGEGRRGGRSRRGRRK